MTPLANLVAYSVQLAVLALAASLMTRTLQLRAPLPSLRYWQAILVISLTLPCVQFFGSAQAIDSPAATFAAFATPSSIRVMTTAGPAGIVVPWLLYVVIAGAAIRILWLAVGLARLRRIISGAERTASLDPLLQELAASLPVAATVAITDDVQTPATVGVRRPLILLPRRLLALPERVQRAVIAHELIHVSRGDWLHTIAEEIWCALLWFHPAARLIASRLSLARETVVDEKTILLTRDRRAYAEALLAFANPQPHLPGVIALIGRRHLSQRISLIVQEEIMTRRRLTVSLAIALVVAGTATSAAVTAFPMTRSAGQSTVYEPGNGVSLPVVVEEFRPEYTREAMQKGIQGSVWMDAIVGSSGDVTDVKVSKSLDAEYGLDAAAVETAYKWKFKPAMKDGQPVAVRVTLEMTFRLK